jgi:hypothetical protein
VEIAPIQTLRSLAADLSYHPAIVCELLIVEGVEIVGKDGNTRLLEADTVITAFGLVRNAAVIEELAGIVPETYIGSSTGI